jgi:hypothetical protein
MRQLPSRFAHVDAASAASLQRLEFQITSLHAWLDRIETRLDKLTALRRAAVTQRPKRNMH